MHNYARISEEKKARERKNTFFKVRRVLRDAYETFCIDRG